MQTIRDNIASIPGAVSSVYSSLRQQDVDMQPNASTSTAQEPERASSVSSISGDESEKSHAIPNTLIKEQWQLILGQEATIYELEAAIERCKELVINSDECSVERKWLVRHLVELRFRLTELEESIEDPCANPEFSKVFESFFFVQSCWLFNF